MAQLTSAAPCFAVVDVSKTIRWYEEQLGFHGHPFPENEPHAFGILVRDQIEIMLQRVDNYQKPDLYSKRDGGVWDAYIRMKGVREFYESINDRVEILRPLQKQFYGDWEFEVKDPNGYVLVFSELID
ncbi:MAG: VOC family protein [Pyrinomonadaceae bacterium]